VASVLACIDPEQPAARLLPHPKPGYPKAWTPPACPP
jgi:hypothetical protein